MSGIESRVARITDAWEKMDRLTTTDYPADFVSAGERARASVLTTWIMDELAR